MSIAVVVGVHDGVVLAADSASTLTIAIPSAVAPGAIPGGVVNVYDNANKIVNLQKRCPLGCITFGSGSIGNASIATLLKDLRKQVGSSEWPFNPNSYTIQGVAETLARFLDGECSKIKDPILMNNTNIGFLLGGYSRPGDLGGNVVHRDS
jgi:hypothetical protein